MSTHSPRSKFITVRLSLQKKRRPVLSAKDVASCTVRKTTRRIQFGAKLFDDQQKAVIRSALNGNNIFITGGAGTGKSYVLREVIIQLRNAGKRVAVTASTGCAAVAISGTTIHSYCGIGIQDGVAVKQVSDVTKNRLMGIDVLVIDEISMIDANTFDRIEKICSLCREEEKKYIRKPFEGIQIILSGDFCQLPPISLTKENQSISFCFESVAWRKCKLLMFQLGNTHRQKDVHFSALLNELRLGIVSPSTLTIMRSLSPSIFKVSEKNEHLKGFTKLFPCRFQVDVENKSRLEKLNGYGIRYTSTDQVGKLSVNNKNSDIWSSSGHIPSPRHLELKIGCRVICTKNLHQALGIVNGSAGEVIGFERPTRKVRQKSLSYRRNPLEQNTKRCFQNLKSMVSKGTDMEIRNNFILMNAVGASLLPSIKFDNGVRLTMSPCQWDLVNENGNKVMYRSQFPLVLGWAFSIHKSQGMSLDRVQVDLSRCFDYGQAYVALSRAKSVCGLRVKGFGIHSVKVHPKVLKFYE